MLPAPVNIPDIRSTLNTAADIFAGMCIVAMRVLNLQLMKTFGLILIIAGIAMIVIRGFSVKTEKKVVDVGPLEVNKTENRWIGWPTYAGGIVAVVGLVLVLSNRKK
jgi:hypothetical protein